MKKRTKSQRGYHNKKQNGREQRKDGRALNFDFFLSGFREIQVKIQSAGEHTRLYDKENRQAPLIRKKVVKSVVRV